MVVFENAVDDIIGQPASRGVDRELSLLEPIESAAAGANPQRTLGVLVKRLADARRRAR